MLYILWFCHILLGKTFHHGFVYLPLLVSGIGDFCLDAKIQTEVGQGSLGQVISS